ncbi:MAG: hypothetical protein HY738_04980, partial [Bacteroidia bacterium]|nr:hypothetical protein [Bacteroidia bacterium]
MKLIKALIIFFLSICSCINIFGQNPKLDSLLNVYKNSAHDSIRCRLMLEIGNQFQKQSPDTSLQWYNNAYKTATKTENHDEIFKLYAAGSLQASGCVERYYKGNYQKALEYTNKSFNIYQTIAAKSKSREIQKKAKKGMAEALMNIGNANWLQFSYNVAIEKYKQAAKLYKLLNDSSNLALAYS